MITASAVLLVTAAAAFGFRLARGPSLVDRVVAVNGLLLVGMAGLAANAVATGVGAFLPVLVVASLVGFIGTAIIARFVEDQGR